MKHLMIWLSMLTLISLACLAPTATIKQDTKPAPSLQEKVDSNAAPLQMTVCAYHLNVRSDAGQWNASKGVLEYGQAVTLTGEAKTPDNSVHQWVEISAPVAGWVNSLYLCEVK